MKKTSNTFIIALFLLTAYCMQPTGLCGQGIDSVAVDENKSGKEIDLNANENSDKSLELNFSDYDWNAKGSTPQTSESIVIGGQTWMQKNLNVNSFRNGDLIPEAKTDDEWQNAIKKKKPAWCNYNNDAANEEKYGKLYNYYAVTDTRGLAPDGWKIPSTDDWDKLKNELGGNFNKMKSAGEWKEGPNGTNESSFSGLPAGYRPKPGDYQFLHMGYVAYWWSSVSFISGDANYGYRLAYNKSLSKDDFKMAPNSSSGLSVRCVKE